MAKASANRAALSERYVAVEKKGAAGVGLGEMPLTLFIIVAAIVLFFYLRRASLGIDQHPGEGRQVPLGPAIPPGMQRGPTFQPSPAPGKLLQPAGVRLTPTVLY